MIIILRKHSWPIICDKIYSVLYHLFYQWLGMKENYHIDQQQLETFIILNNLYPLILSKTGLYLTSIFLSLRYVIHFEYPEEKTGNDIKIYCYGSTDNFIFK